MINDPWFLCLASWFVAVLLTVLIVALDKGTRSWLDE